jgi:Endoribonuclease GhoS
MAEMKAYSVRVELLRPRETSYTRLAREMYKKGFKHVLKGGGGEWTQLPKGSFVISTAESVDMIKRTATNIAVALDETALIKLAPVIRWAA